MKTARLLPIALMSTTLSYWPTHAGAWDPIRDLTGKPIHEHGEKIVKEVGNAFKDTGREIDRLRLKTIDEIGNAAEDIRILVEQGKCGGDICDALDAVVIFTEETVIDFGNSIENAAKRIEEGKIIDALWHFGTDPLNDVQENAAEAAARSSVLRAVGQVAAGVYGGPAGAAAYAAWLTYNMTDGNLELALKAGVIAGASAYAFSEVSGMEGFDIVEDVAIDEVIQRAILSGAVSGLAVAASGGDEMAIENAITAGITMAVIRDGYRELTTTNLEDNLRASNGEPYCLAADPSSGRDCLPPSDAYVKNREGDIIFRDGKPEIDVTKLDAQRPHVGMFATDPNDPIYSGTETSNFMVGVSKIPGMNAMAVGHDIFDIRYNRVGDIPLNDSAMATLEQVVRVGTIAPSVVLTYEGAGFRVHEMIREEVAKAQDDPVPAEPSELEPGEPLTNASNASEDRGVLSEVGPAHEIRNLVCRGEVEDSAKVYLMEVALDPDGVADGDRICTVAQYEEREWRHLWHAHNEPAFCVSKFNSIATSSVERGMRCAFSIGLRYGKGDEYRIGALESTEAAPLGNQ